MDKEEEEHGKVLTLVLMFFFSHFRLWDQTQGILDGPTGCSRGQILISVRPVTRTLIQHGKSLPQLHLGPSPHRESDPAHAGHLLQLPGPVVGRSGQFGSNKSIIGPDIQL